MAIIDQVEILPFTFEVPDLGLGEHAAMGVSNLVYAPGETLPAMRIAPRIRTSDGAEGAYVCNWVSPQATLGQMQMLAPHLLGRDADRRELIYDDFKRELRAYDRMGHGPLDIALWDLAGKRRDTSVSRLLGGYRERLFAYASTHHGQESGGGLDSPDAFGDYAVACREAGFRGFKIHGWHDGEVRREAATVLKVRAAVGEDMRLMVDPGCQLRTFGDALYLGRACDEAGYFWYEDPFRDASAAATAHKALRDKLATPLMLTEYIRGLESKANFILAGACDMAHIDPEYDMGITGLMKIVHFCELLGLDVQVHACGPAHRACISAIRNTHFYELALVGPGMANIVPPVYTCGYSDHMADVAADGSVPVPDGPGLGVSYDWDYIERHATDRLTFNR